MLVTFCGHSSIKAREQVEIWLAQVLRQLIEQGATIFYVGGYGAVDELANSVLVSLKQEYLAIKIVLVLAYLNKKIDTVRYTDTMYPPLETVPKKYAIARRNKWMVQESDVVVAYVIYPVGGATKTLEYAKQKKKQIVLYLEKE